mgnify:CR=1 FL=1
MKKKPPYYRESAESCKTCQYSDWNWCKKFKCEIEECMTCNDFKGREIFEIKLYSIKEICIDGLETDGSHHKQWYFELILDRLGYDVEQLEEEEEEKGYGWERGIPS